MWIFLPGGLLMPADVPMDLADPNFTEGVYDLQVRARSVQHLKNFMEMYMKPGTFHDEIQLNPDMDYNCRFYTTREAFSAGLALAVADIDYEKFKPTAEAKGEDGELLYGTKAECATYHSVLNSIWGTVCRIGSPGGMWGRSSKANPNGFGSASKYADDEGYRPSQYPPYVYGGRGSSFGTRDDELEFEQDDMDWTPSRESLIADILKDLDGIPSDQWEDYLTAEEFSLVKPLRVQERKETKRLSRKITAAKRKNAFRRLKR